MVTLSLQNCRVPSSANKCCEAHIFNYFVKYWEAHILKYFVKCCEAHIYDICTYAAGP